MTAETGGLVPRNLNISVKSLKSYCNKSVYTYYKNYPIDRFPTNIKLRVKMDVNSN
jgi:hypothetical protein